MNTLRQDIVNTINREDDGVSNDAREMITALSRDYEDSVIRQILEEQNPPLVVVNRVMYVAITERYTDVNELTNHPWVKVASINRHSEVNWRGETFHDLLIDREISSEELDDLLKDIIITWRPLI